MTAYLQSFSCRKRVVVVCPNDPHTQYAVLRALEEGIAEFLLITNPQYASQVERIKNQHPAHVDVLMVPTPDEAAVLAVQIVREGKADVLMKGLINTDNLLHAVLNKETGILPRGEVLTHVTVAHVPTYPKLLIFSDAAVIPRPTLAQFKAIVRYTAEAAHSCGVEEPRIALLHCSEKINEKFPHTLDYAVLKECAIQGEFGRVQMDGPMDVKTTMAASGNTMYTQCIQSMGVVSMMLTMRPKLDSARSAGMKRDTTPPLMRKNASMGRKATTESIVP